MLELKLTHASKRGYTTDVPISICRFTKESRTDNMMFCDSEVKFHLNNSNCSEP